MTNMRHAVLQERNLDPLEQSSGQYKRVPGLGLGTELVGAGASSSVSKPSPGARLYWPLLCSRWPCEAARYVHRPWEAPAVLRSSTCGMCSEVELYRYSLRIATQQAGIGSSRDTPPVEMQACCPRRLKVLHAYSIRDALHTAA